MKILFPISILFKISSKRLKPIQTGFTIMHVNNIQTNDWRWQKFSSLLWTRLFLINDWFNTEIIGALISLLSYSVSSSLSYAWANLQLKVKSQEAYLSCVKIFNTLKYFVSNHSTSGKVKIKKLWKLGYCEPIFAIFLP